MIELFKKVQKYPWTIPPSSRGVFNKTSIIFDWDLGGRYYASVIYTPETDAWQLRRHTTIPYCLVGFGPNAQSDMDEILTGWLWPRPPARRFATNTVNEEN